MSVQTINMGRMTPAVIPFNDGVVRRDGDGSIMFALNLEAATAFFKDITIRKSNVILNDMNLYTLLPVGRDGKFKTQNLSVPRHLLQSRKDCVTWSPKGKATLTSDEIVTYAYEYMGEQCVDSFFDSCMEKIFPAGNEVWDFTGTPEGQALFAMLVDNIFTSLGNSFNDLSWYSNYSYITTSDTNNYWVNGYSTEDEWTRFKAQQTDTSLVGFVPIIENYKTDGREQFNVSIASNEVSGKQFVGDIIDFFDRVDRAARPEFRQILNRRSGNFSAVRLVSPAIFDAYYDYLHTTHNGIIQGYQLLVNGEAVPGVLMYKGVPVVSMDEWLLMDEMLGVTSFRCVATVLGNFAIAHNMASPQARQFDGLGFVAQQRADLRNKGTYDMYTTFKLGTDILNPNLMVNASRTDEPS